jgi:Ricin-type beta-trefoil lectin domain-like/Secretion system C-terminal sorting domain/Tectonin domain
MKNVLLLLTLCLQGVVLWGQLPRFNHGLTEWTEGWQAYPGGAKDVDVNADGTMWISGTDSRIYFWNSETNTWNYSNGDAHKVAAGPSETWCINLSANYIYRYNPDANGWEIKPGRAIEIAIGADGTVWCIGIGNGGLFKFDNEVNTWIYSGVSGMKKVAVDPDGNPWVIRNDGSVARWNGAAWENLPGCLAEIAIGSDGAVWGLGCDWGNGGYSVWRWNGSNWSNVDGRLTSIAVLPNGGAAGSNSYGTIFYRNCNTILGDYVIQSVHNGLVVDESAPNSRVHLWDYWGGSNQLWRIRRMGDDASLSIQNRYDGRYLVLEGGSLDNGGKYIAWDWNGGLNQRYYIDEYDPENAPYQYLITGLNSGLVMDVAGLSYNRGDYLQQWDFTGALNQQWYLWQMGLSYAQPGVELASLTQPLPTLPGTADLNLKSKSITASQLRLYPNPAQEQFTLEIKLDAPQKTILNISDITGKVVLQRNLELVKGANQVQVELERSLPNGIYTVQVVGFKAERMIVQH